LSVGTEERRRTEPRRREEERGDLEHVADRLSEIAGILREHARDRRYVSGRTLWSTIRELEELSERLRRLGRGEAGGRAYGARRGAGRPEPSAGELLARVEGLERALFRHYDERLRELEQEVEELWAEIDRLEDRLKEELERLKEREQGGARGGEA